jgi:beta-fructofuranosidase
VVSPYGKVLQMVGTYADQKLTVERTAPLDLSPVYYAPNCFVDDAGRLIMWGWIQERRSEEETRQSGWAGAMSLPRVITPGADGLVSFAPAAEVEALRDDHVRLGDLAIEPGVERPAPGVEGDCLEIVAEIDPGSATAVGIRIRCSPDGEEQTLISYDADVSMLAAERQRSTLAAGADLDMHGDAFSLRPGENLRLRIFLDRSVVEVFANGRAALTTRLYPTRDDSLGVGFFACGGTAKLVSLDAWTMESIW